MGGLGGKPATQSVADRPDGAALQFGAGAVRATPRDVRRLRWRRRGRNGRALIKGRAKKNRNTNQWWLTGGTRSQSQQRFRAPNRIWCGARDRKALRARFESRE